MAGVDAVDNDTHVILEHIQKDITELKKIQAEFLGLMQKYAEIKQEVSYQVKRADEGRKMIWKRMDSQQTDIEQLKAFQTKILFTVASSSLALLVAIILGSKGLI
jgi:hypothetical protein